MSEHPYPNADANTPLNRYAWPGGYPIAYYQTGDGESGAGAGDVLCATCAWEAITTDDAPMAGEVYWEGAPVQCADCGGLIDSAYGEPDDIDPQDSIDIYSPETDESPGVWSEGTIAEDVEGHSWFAP